MGYKWVADLGWNPWVLLVVIDIYWFCQITMPCAAGYKLVTNGLQVWDGIHRFCCLSLIFIGFARYGCPVQRVTNGLQMSYRWGGESIGVVGFIDIYLFYEISMPCASGYKWATNGLQSWVGIHRCCEFVDTY